MRDSSVFKPNSLKFNSPSMLHKGPFRAVSLRTSTPEDMDPLSKSTHGHFSALDHIHLYFALYK